VPEPRHSQIFEADGLPGHPPAKARVYPAPTDIEHPPGVN
jgi:hypothetical protein